MAPSLGQIALSYGGTEVLLSAPEVPCETEIDLPFDFVELDTGLTSIRDNGVKYDKRVCSMNFILSPTEQGNLNTLINSTARGKDLTLTLPSGSGVFPFGPDKGDEGPFTVSVMLKSTPAIQSNPFRYFKCQLEMRNTGSFPAYALPAEIAEGSFTIGTVSNLRMPEFSPEQVYSISVDFTENSQAKYVDRGSLGDYAGTQFDLPCNESKAAALLYYLTNTARANSFTITTADYFYALGSDRGSADTYTVKLADRKIKIKHNRFNSFSIALNLKKVA